MNLTRSIFWDTNYDQINWEEKSKYVIGKVLNYGTFSDWQEINSYYGSDHIKELVTHIRDLDSKAMYFTSLIFDLPLESFLCYTSKQSTPAHWNY